MTVLLVGSVIMPSNMKAISLEEVGFRIPKIEMKLQAYSAFHFSILLLRHYTHEKKIKR